MLTDPSLLSFALSANPMKFLVGLVLRSARSGEMRPWLGLMGMGRGKVSLAVRSNRPEAVFDTDAPLPCRFKPGVDLDDTNRSTALSESLLVRRVVEGKASAEPRLDRSGVFSGSGVTSGTASRCTSSRPDMPGKAMRAELSIASSWGFLRALDVAFLSTVCLNHAGSLLPRLAAISDRSGASGWLSPSASARPTESGLGCPLVLVLARRCQASVGTAREGSWFSASGFSALKSSSFPVNFSSAPA